MFDKINGIYIKIKMRR